jgi:2-oxoacid:acceptor oxidoreductase gamma subunit (pyruvate/2-ketoisovalerate family)
MAQDRFEISFNGRGGQGAVTAATILAKAAFKTGQYPFVMAFPVFGPERRGAPVQAFARISAREIHERDKIYNPDIVIVMDASTLRTANPIPTLREDGVLLVNTGESPESLREAYTIPDGIKVGVVDITKICIEINLFISGNAPVFNTPVLGAFCRMIDAIPLETMLEAIRENFPGQKNAADLNVQGASLAYERIMIN